MGIFDFHVRLTPAPAALDRLIAVLDETGITRAAVAAGGVVSLDQLARQLVEGGHAEGDADNDAVLVACERSGGRLLPFYFGNPYGDATDYQRRAHLFRGLELSPAVHGVGFDDPRMIGLVGIADRAGHPVYTVTTNRPGCRTEDLLALAAAFPGTTFVFGHCGFIGIDTHGVRQIAAAPNIVAETSGCFTVVARLAVEVLGPERVIFATEFPLQHPGVELAKYAALGLDPAAWQHISWRNAHRLFREDPP